MFKVNISKWLNKEIVSTELALLRAEDELNEAQYRVKAIRSRLGRLQGKQRKASPASAPVEHKVLAAREALEQQKRDNAVQPQYSAEQQAVLDGLGIDTTVPRWAQAAMKLHRGK